VFVIDSRCIHCGGVGVETPRCRCINHWEVDLDGSQKNLLVQNTPGSRDSPMISKLGSLDSLVHYSPESFFVYLF
jgi:hypothetical protein